MKLVEILARELKEWPEDSCCIVQDGDGDIKGMGSTYARLDKDVWQRDIPTDFYEEGFKISDDWSESFVTRAQWKAERARIATNNWKATQEAREISKAGTMTNEEQELTAIACGKRSKEDQALWDKVATDLFVRWSMEYDSENDRKETIRNAMASADAFMAERVKRMKE